MLKFAFHLAILLALLLSSQIQQAVAETIDEEPTCKLEQSGSDCDDPEKISDTTSSADITSDGMKRTLISLTDENFDELTWTSTPSTWLIMFKTDACGICKKAMPEFEKLASSAELAEHNSNQERLLKEWVFVKDAQVEEGQTPIGPVKIATIDASWAGRDTTKRFGVDATPTIIVVRNEGYDDDMDDSRIYATYRGQRAHYPLRNFVLGGFNYRSKSTVPPPLPAGEAKSNSYLGRYIEVGKPYFAWVGKLLGVWFAFISILGLFMRVHNYAWSDNDEDVAVRAKQREEAIEREFAEGKNEYKINQSKEAELRQQKMLQRKMENRAKFAAKKEARKKKVQPIDGELDGDDDFIAVGVAVKKSDVKKDMEAAAAKAKTN